MPLVCLDTVVFASGTGPSVCLNACLVFEELHPALLMNYFVSGWFVCAKIFEKFFRISF